MILRDLAYSVRSFRRTPSILVSAVLALALGIGANATMLRVLDLLLLRLPAHVSDPESVRRLLFVDRRSGQTGRIVSYPMYADLVGRVDGLSGVAAFAPRMVSFGRGQAAREVAAVVATPSFFTLLGVRPVRGRLFTEREGDPDVPGLVALVSWELWQRAFGGAPDILGRALPIGRDVYTVVGVLPPGFIGIDLAPVDLWLPIGAIGPLDGVPHLSTARNSFCLALAGRLREGASPAQVAGQVGAVLRGRFGAMGPHAVELGPVQEGRSPDTFQPVPLAGWLAATSAAVLLIACLNVASLLVVRGLERRRELAVRLALGAGRAGLARLLLTESLALALLGGVAAYAVARLGRFLVERYLLWGTPPATGLDFRLLAILAALTLAAGLGNGLAPALWAGRRDLAETIKVGGREGAPGRTRLRSTLITAQVALTVVLLVGAGLFVRSLENVRRLRLGFDLDPVLVASVNLQSAGYKAPQIGAFFDRALERVRHLPGVRHASLATGIPFRYYTGTWLAVPGRADLDRLAPGGEQVNSVAGDYFATLGTALRLGRPLTAEDARGRVRVAVVNETAARLLWPGESPLGRCIQVGGEPCSTVVGVVEDAWRGAVRDRKATIQVYLPLSPATQQTSRALFVRAAGDPELLAGAVRRELQAVAPGLPFVDLVSLAEMLDPQVRDWRTGTVMLALFGVLALALATIGIFAAVAYAVASRTHELGVRLALGARTRDTLWLVMRFGFVPALAGAALGEALAAAAGPYVEPLLFNVPARDPAVAAAAVLALLAAALVASYLPGRRARRIDPASAMRSE